MTKSKTAGESMEGYFSYLVFSNVLQCGMCNSKSQDHKEHLEQNKI